VKDALPERCVADGEIVLPGENGLEFELLQLRLHPAESRVRKLAAEIPATFVAFDLLAEGRNDLRERPFAERRANLVNLLTPQERCFVTPQTDDPEEASRWFDMFEGAGLDGVVAKRFDQRYAPRERVMVKVKHERTADCVVGGYRLAKDRKGVGSLLLGLYSDKELHYVGFTSSFRAPERIKLREMLQPLETEAAESFGVERAPGGPSRWNQGKDVSWIPLKPVLVCEVAFDHLQGGHRFRHGTTFKRWRPDRDPADCTWDQFKPPAAFKLEDIRVLSQRSASRTVTRARRSRAT
jgi:ATP-dependent DNA ligase